MGLNLRLLSESIYLSADRWLESEFKEPLPRLGIVVERVWEKRRVAKLPLPAEFNGV
jgi:hypothetical protein